MTYRLAPSILSADFARLGEEIRAIEDGGADLIHFDVMDNHYVPNLTLGPLICEALRPVARIPIDVHIMAHPVDALVPMFAKSCSRWMAGSRRRTSARWRRRRPIRLCRARRSSRHATRMADTGR